MSLAHQRIEKARQGEEEAQLQTALERSRLEAEHAAAVKAKNDALREMMA